MRSTSSTFTGNTAAGRTLPLGESDACRDVPLAWMKVRLWWWWWCEIELVQSNRSLSLCWEIQNHQEQHEWNWLSQESANQLPMDSCWEQWVHCMVHKSCQLLENHQKRNNNKEREVKTFSSILLCWCWCIHILSRFVTSKIDLMRRRMRNKISKSSKHALISVELGLK